MNKWTEKDNIKEEEKNINDYLNLNNEKKIIVKDTIKHTIKHDYNVVVPDILYKRELKKKNKKN